MSSQRLRRLASETGRTPAVIPLDREPPPRRSWKRWLPLAFLGLSLVALVGMAMGMASIPGGGISLAEGVQLALLATLVAGIVAQGRAAARSTPPGRWLAGHLPSFRREPRDDTPEPTTRGRLDAVPAEHLASIAPATAPRSRRRSRARRLWNFIAGRGLLFLVLALALLGFVALLAGLAWAAWAGGITDPGVLLGAPFTALGGFATWQLFTGASRSAYRGRPVYLANRAFRDSVRVWGSGSLLTRVALTGSATAAVAGATIVPGVLDKPYEYSIFVHDRATGAIYQVDLQSGESSQFGERSFAAVPQGLMTAPRAFARASVPFPKGTMLAVVSDPAGARQAVLALRPGARRADLLGRIEPALTSAYFAATPGGIVAANPGDGGFWRIDHESGTATRVGSLGAPAGPLAWNPTSSTLAMVSDGTAYILDPATGAVRNSISLALPEGVDACGIAGGPKGSWFLTDGTSARLFGLRPDGTLAGTIEPTGEAPATACAVTVAPRRVPGELAATGEGVVTVTP